MYQLENSCQWKIANLISKLNFYKLIHPIQWTICLTGRRRPARQTEKDVLCYHRLAGP